MHVGHKHLGNANAAVGLLIILKDCRNASSDCNAAAVKCVNKLGLALFVPAETNLRSARLEILKIEQELGQLRAAIADYEDAVFFDILAEELARRDMDDAAIDESNFAELTRRMDAYMAEFEAHGTDHVQVESDLI